MTAGPALMICQRCSSVVGTAHGQPECDGMYDAKYRRAYAGGTADLSGRLAAAEAREARVRALLDDPGLMPYIRRKIRAALDA